MWYPISGKMILYLIYSELLSHQWATVTLTTLAKIGKQAPHASEELKLGTLAIVFDPDDCLLFPLLSYVHAKAFLLYDITMLGSWH